MIYAGQTSDQACAEVDALLDPPPGKNKTKTLSYLAKTALKGDWDPSAYEAWVEEKLGAQFLYLDGY